MFDYFNNNAIFLTKMADIYLEIDPKDLLEKPDLYTPAVRIFNALEGYRTRANYLIQKGLDPEGKQVALASLASAQIQALRSLVPDLDKQVSEHQAQLAQAINEIKALKD